MEDYSNLSIEQIKKMTQSINEEVDELEAQLKKKIPLKISTSTDELLRQLIEQLHISNQLSVATYKKTQIDDSIGSNVNPYLTKGDITERVKVNSDNYKTIVKNTGNTTITGSGKLFEIKGSGIVAECKFKSSNSTVNNKVYGVRIMSDNSIAYQDTWDNFFNRSFHEVDMSCWEDGGNNCYLLVFQKIAFAKDLIIEVYGSTASFTDIYLKYHLKV